MNKDLILLIGLLVLVVISVAQAIQLNDIRNTVDEEGLTVSTPSPASSSAESSEVSVPKNIEELPGMVGGC